MRTVAWFSCGDASAVACALAVKERSETVVAHIVLTSEHPDNERFAADCARWYGRELVRLQSDEYRDTWDVWERKRYIAGIAGAPCTTALKKEVRFAFQRPDDCHVFGFTAEESKRAETFRRNNFELDVWFPLIERGLTKQDCHALVRAQGIELPAMYRLGFQNNNCIGCPKGGAGYWNMIRDHFPAQFARMAELSRRLGARIIKQDGARIFLDELRSETGRRTVEPDVTCSPLCEQTISAT
jgi:3'-phosphoadenosine 5'-phosphosulfate sulfotransferase (PAPS reductase)/FAD synthetase